MSSAADFPVPITALGATKGGTVLFRQGGKLHLTCVLKSSFQFVSGAPMKIVTPRELVRHEKTHYNNPCWSIESSSELVPYLPRVDVVMTGRACAPTGRWVPRVNVRLAIYHGIALLDKTVHVYGNHNGKDFELFERMPLEYERAFGGPGHLENPYGTGILAGSPLPNLISPKDPGAVAGFGPLAQRLPLRASKLGTMSLSALHQPTPEFPDDFDWSFFQAAPLDQRLPSLMGNEWLILEGVHPAMTRLSSRLPSVRPLATIFGTNPDNPEEAQTLQLRIDMLSIDADALRCDVLARGVVQLPDERALKTMRIAAAMETEELSFAQVLTPPGGAKRGAGPMPQQPAMTMRMDATADKLQAVSVEVPTLRQEKLPALTPTGTLALDQEPSRLAKPIDVPIIRMPAIEDPPSLAATLDTYHVDLSVPSERAPVPPEPEWLDESDLEEVYSVDPDSNPMSIRAKLVERS